MQRFFIWILTANFFRAFHGGYFLKYSEKGYYVLIFNFDLFVCNFGEETNFSLYFWHLKMIFVDYN